MNCRFPLAAITDEFSPDLETAIRAMIPIGIERAELRVLWGKNIMDLDDQELDRAKAMLDHAAMRTIGIASPIFKCILPNSPPPDNRLEQDVFLSVHSYDIQQQLMRRAFEIAHKMGAPLIRVFSFWRTVDPAACAERIAGELCALAEHASREDIIIGLENEHTCNAGSTSEMAEVLSMANHPNLKAVWDPANGYVAGENPFPEGYAMLRASCIAHVHAKDCRLNDGKPEWLPLGTGSLDWKGILMALSKDGYSGAVSLETHWRGPANDKLTASTVCGWNLRSLTAWCGDPDGLKAHAKNR